jgi:hypothetical protein
MEISELVRPNESNHYVTVQLRRPDAGFPTNRGLAKKFRPRLNLAVYLFFRWCGATHLLIAQTRGRTSSSGIGRRAMRRYIASV